VKIENPIFKEIKIAITPMISSLSILNHVKIDSESGIIEVLSNAVDDGCCQIG